MLWGKPQYHFLRQWDLSFAFLRLSIQFLFYCQKCKWNSWKKRDLQGFQRKKDPARLLLQGQFFYCGFTNWVCPKSANAQSHFLDGSLCSKVNVWGLFMCCCGFAVWCVCSEEIFSISSSLITQSFFLPSAVKVARTFAVPLRLRYQSYVESDVGVTLYTNWLIMRIKG